MVAAKDFLGPGPIQLSKIGNHGPELRRAALQFHSRTFQPLSFFLWGLSPAISILTGRELIPTYAFFRIYREGDICRVHADRPSCEHSISLTLDYSDGEPWDLQVATERTERGQELTDGFGSSAFASIRMNIGDAVLYRGVHHRHGRITPNPNAWSAHLFLHFVERGGPYEREAFDGQSNHGPVNFAFS